MPIARFEQNKTILSLYHLCSLLGNYHISLTYDGLHVDHSPYRLTLHSRSSEEQVVPPTSNTPVRVLVDPTDFFVNTASVVNVRPKTPCHVFQAYIQVPQGNMNLPITVHKSAKSGFDFNLKKEFISIF